MNKPSSVSSAELARFLEGEVTVARAAEIHDAIASDPTTTKRHAQLKTMLGSLAERDEAIAGIRLYPMLRDRLQAEPPRRERSMRAWWAGGLSLATAAAAVLLMVKAPHDEGFTPKGGLVPAEKWAGVQAFVQHDGVQPLGSSMCAQDELMFSFTNSGPAPYSHLMIFLVDARGETHWYYPAYTDEKTNPTSITIASGTARRELSDKVRHELANGDARIYALFSPSALSVKDVEQAVAQHKTSDQMQLKEIVRDGHGVQQIIPVQVRTCP